MSVKTVDLDLTEAQWDWIEGQPDGLSTVISAMMDKAITAQCISMPDADLEADICWQRAYLLPLPHQTADEIAAGLQDYLAGRISDRGVMEIIDEIMPDPNLPSDARQTGYQLTEQAAHQLREHARYAKDKFPLPSARSNFRQLETELCQLSKAPETAIELFKDDAGQPMLGFHVQHVYLVIFVPQQDGTLSILGLLGNTHRVFDYMDNLRAELTKAK